MCQDYMIVYKFFLKYESCKILNNYVIFSVKKYILVSRVFSEIKSFWQQYLSIVSGREDRALKCKQKKAPSSVFTFYTPWFA